MNNKTMKKKQWLKKTYRKLVNFDIISLISLFLTKIQASQKQDKTMIFFKTQYIQSK